ncbi:MAG: hypothetical protein ACLT1T_02895 [Oscillospiraceae bacterium]
MQARKDQGIETLPKGVEIANADDVVDMHDDPATVVKKKKDSSMVVGLTMLKEGGGDAFVSAGSTGALLSAATLIVRRVKGIRRAAMGPHIPTKTGRECVLIDCGATADCTPEFLLQFAFMGSYYAEKVLGIENPRVALLNIGAEDSKGGELQKAVYPLLKQAGEAGRSTSPATSKRVTCRWAARTWSFPTASPAISCSRGSRAQRFSWPP